MKILGTGHFLPEKILSNSDLEKMVDTNDEWIFSRTGIKQRHILEKGKGTSDMGYEASLKALKMANLNPQDIDLIIVGTSTPDMVFPSTAQLIQKKLGCRNSIPGFDFQIACSSFSYGIIIASQFISTGYAKKVLLVTADAMSRIIDYTDRNTCILFGDGASALVLGESSENHLLGYDFGGNGFEPSETLSVPLGGSLNPLTKENINNNSRYIQMEGREVYRLALKHMSETLLESCKKARIETSDLDFVIPHQANLRIMQGVAKKLGLSSNQVISTIQNHANTSGSSIGISLDISIHEGKIKRGDILGLTGFGAGLAWGSCIVKF